MSTLTISSSSIAFCCWLIDWLIFFVCIYVCFICVCMHACVHVFMYACMYLCMFYLCVCACMYVHVRVCVCLCLCMYVCTGGVRNKWIKKFKILTFDWLAGFCTWLIHSTPTVMESRMHQSVTKTREPIKS